MRAIILEMRPAPTTRARDQGRDPDGLPAAARYGDSRRHRGVLFIWLIALALPGPRITPNATGSTSPENRTRLPATPHSARGTETTTTTPSRSAKIAGSARAAGLPWEIWEDLYRFPEVPLGDQVLLRSSHCPTGCRFDRHSDGDRRYISVDGDEGVIFEEAGAGAVTRIWMTMGFGISEPLTPDARIRVYVDGGELPVVDLPLPDLFNGSTAPFLPPLVGERLSSSGGNYSYVPIPYRDGCRVSLVGAHKERIWFQFNFHRLDAPGEITSFTGDEDLSAWASLLSLQSTSPWSGTEPWQSSSAEVGPGAQMTFLERSGPGSVTTMLLRAAPEHWSDLELLLAFDGEERVRMPLADFFAIGRGGALPTRSLFLGLDESGRLYSYFPMPFFESAEVAVRHLGPPGAPGVKVSYEIRGSARAPSPRSGIFGAALSVSDRTQIGVDFPLLELEGHGKWVGLFAQLRSVDTMFRSYLEGDERVFIDDSLHPSVYGTGVEDFFNGGFYFDKGPFSKSLHGSPYVHLIAGGESLTAAYRLMPTDGITFAHGITAGLEGGNAGEISMRARIVAYYYQRPAADLHRWDVLDLGDPASRLAHAYSATSPFSLRSLDSRFEGEPPRTLTATGIYRPPGSSGFVLRGPEASTRFRLRRRFDAGLAGQEAEIYVDGALVGRFPPVDVNTDRRWREIDIDLAPVVAGGGGELAFQVVVPSPASGGGGTFTEFVYELWADGDAEISTEPAVSSGRRSSLMSSISGMTSPPSIAPGRM